MTGFGGQGIQTISLIIAIAAIEKDLEVTYLPSYGVEKRGGRTDVTVIISDEEIGSPITNTPRSVIALDSIGLVFYQPMLRRGSLLIANSSLIPKEKIDVPEEVDVMTVDFNSEANSLGNAKYANMVTLGCFVERLPFLDFEDIKLAVNEVIPERLKDTIPDNLKAIERGITISEERGTK
jgi:2-oxoglutarate ferredoxin oxidoreductase subunit gamma